MQFVLSVLYAKYISLINSGIWSIYSIEAVLLFNVTKISRKEVTLTLSFTLFEEELFQRLD